MSYVDGFVFALPKKKVAEYKRIARKAGKVWMEHGALAYQECLGDEIRRRRRAACPSRHGPAKPPSFIGFSWIVYVAPIKTRSRRS
jgi:uncharacterized protein YbaA (DUF1428 family)